MKTTVIGAAIGLAVIAAAAGVANAGSVRGDDRPLGVPPRYPQRPLVRRQ
jgi:hypothetical protein